MSTIFLDCEAALTPQDLEAAEATLGFALPDELKAHYLRYNGGTPEQSVWQVDELLYFEIAQFEPIRYKADQDNPADWTLEGIYSNLAQDKALPPSLLPFAEDWGGNYFCLNRDTHEVVYQAMDAENAQPTVLAPSFTEFLEGLVTLDDEDEDDED